MKAEVNREELLALMEKVKLGVGTNRCTLPIISRIILKTGRGKLYAEATNLEFAVIGEVPATCKGEIGACISPDPLIKFLKNVKTDTLTIGMDTTKEASIKEVDAKLDEVKAKIESTREALDIYNSQIVKLHDEIAAHTTLGQETEANDKHKSMEAIIGKKAILDNGLSDLTGEQRELYGKLSTLRGSYAKIAIKAGTSNLALDGEDPENFPPLPEIKKTVKSTVTNLPAAFSKVHHCVSADDSRPSLTGIYLHRDEKGVAKVVAADGFRLGMATLDLKGRTQNIIIPDSTVNVIERLGRKVESMDMRIGMLGSLQGIVFDVDGVQVLSHGIQGDFPDYSRLIPKAIPAKQAAKMKAGDLSDALKVMRSVDIHGGIVKFSHNGKLQLSAHDEEDNTISTEVPASRNGKGTKVALNIKFITDLLTTYGKEDTVTMEVSDTSHPVAFRRDDSLHVIMPMFIQW